MLPAAALFTLSDTYRVVGLSSPRISPDGRSLAFVRSRVNLNTDRRDGVLVLLDIATRRERVIVADKPTISDPQWSRDGRAIAFVADDAGHTTQLWVWDSSTGAVLQVTHASQDVEEFEWRPDGNAIAYLRQDAVAKRTGISRWQDAFRVTDNAYLDPGPHPASHLWLAKRTGAAWTPQRLTQGAWSVAAGSAESTISWNAAGNALAYVRLPDALLGDANRSVVDIFDAAAGKSRSLTKRTRYEFNPRFSPDGRFVAYTYARGGDPMNLADVYVSSGHGPGRDISRSLDANATTYAWYPDSRAILVNANYGTHRVLWRLTLDGRADRIALGEVSAIGDFDGSIGRDGAIAFVGTSPQRQAEIYYLPSNGKLERLTGYNDAIAAKHLASARALTWRGPNGVAEDGVLTYPADYIPGVRYPLVLLIHGGPTGASTLEFDTLAQLMAARHWFVLEPNYRGSDNLGNAYAHAIFRDATQGPGEDILAGVRAAEATNAIDVKRICVSGWSYGGMMTSWLITQSHLWACAVAGAAVDDVVYDYSLADDISSDFEGMGGSPFTGGNLAEYHASSPLTYVRNVMTPTLILSDVYDVRVPAAQSYAFYRALRDEGKTVEFYEWPIGAHFPGDPVRQADVYRYWMDWIARYVDARH